MKKLSQKTRILAMFRANKKAAAVRAQFSASSVIHAMRLAMIRSQPLPRKLWPAGGTRPLWPAMTPIDPVHDVHILGKAGSQWKPLDVPLCSQLDPDDGEAAAREIQFAMQWNSAMVGCGALVINMTGRGTGKTSAYIQQVTAAGGPLDQLQARMQAIFQNPASTAADILKGHRMGRQMAVLLEMMNCAHGMSASAKKMADSAKFFQEEIERIRMQKRAGHHRVGRKKQ